MTFEHMFVIIWSYVQNDEHNLKFLKDKLCLGAVKEEVVVEAWEKETRMSK
ncbi:hypothetical protein BN3087_870051 [Sulfurovum sp. enrichment culture clone C5]|uniref:Uncharacterized protein n=1 Tax=Sulfurovum sp. enrichment culture clone C5 TaxID=497650 RepID=A0A0S4XQI3_9BACT|nr:hypothetical protein BN3087_870051 [Sulfurovum sp. enrichment culture clone C5]